MKHRLPAAGGRRVPGPGAQGAGQSMLPGFTFFVLFFCCLLLPLVSLDQIHNNLDKSLFQNAFWQEFRVVN